MTFDIEVVSDFGKGVPRRKTKLYSLDWALRNRRTEELGMPLRSIIEIYGDEHVGKSTLSDHLSAVVNPNGHVLFMNVDEAMPDTDYIVQMMGNAGFNGTAEFISHVTGGGKPRSHEEMLEELYDRLGEEATVGVLDSVGAFHTTAQSKSDLGEGYGGAKRAIVLGDACSEILHSLRVSDEDKLFIFVNHKRDAMGGMGHRTPGGKRLRDAAAVRIRIWRRKHYKYDDDILGYKAEGVVVKNRYGGKGHNFQMFFLEGRGLHLGLSAVMDCEAFGLAEFPKGAHVRLKGEKIGYIKADIIKAVVEGDDSVCDPFVAALEAHFNGTDDTTGISGDNGGE